MARTTFVQLQPTQPNVLSPGSHSPRVERTEWTPEPTNRVPIRSTWRDAIGAPLTDHRIRAYAAEGRYGDEAKRRELERQENARVTRERRSTKRKLLQRILERYV